MNETLYHKIVIKFLRFLLDFFKVKEGYSPKWATAIYRIFCPIRYYIFFAQEKLRYDTFSKILTVDGLRITKSALDSIAHTTPNNVWFQFLILQNTKTREKTITVCSKIFEEKYAAELEN